MRYSAFISYNHRDKKWATWLHRALEGYRVPARLQGREAPFGTIGPRLPPVFRDRDELASAADLAASVKTALEESATLIVICSPASAASRWVNEEIRTFIALGRREHIRLMIVGGEPGSPDPRQECLPPAILEGGASEPLAADARRHQDGVTGAKLKILAGLLEVPYDDLRRREATRRQRRLIALATATSIGFLLMTGLALTAWFSRNEAIRQRTVAEQRTLTAERTLDFVKGMFRVSDPSEARGATITAREVVDRGAHMLDSGLDKEPAAKADLGVTLAEVYGALGLYRRSDELVRRTFAIHHDQPDIFARQLAALGESQARLGDYDAAVTTFTRAKDFSDGATDAQRSRVLIGLGQAQSAIGAFPEAMRAIDAALTVDRARPVEDARADVARDLEAAGLNKFYSGDAKGAEPITAEALALRRALEGDASPSVADNLNTLASIAYVEGDLAKAEQLYRQNVAVDERVLGKDHPDLAITLNNLARMLIDQRKFAAAQPLLERAIAISVPQRGATHDDMAFFLSNLAITRRAAGQAGAAENLFEQALAVARLHQHRTLAPILTDLADLRCQSGRTAQGLALLPEAAKVMAADYPDDPWRSAWVETVRGACLIAAGQREAGRAVLRKAAPVVEARWPDGTLFGTAARQRAAR